MKVNIKLFAMLRDKAGQSDIELQLADGATIHMATERLAAKRPAIEPYLSRLAYAVNEEYATATTVLHDGDELALIPPVSGG